MGARASRDSRYPRSPGPPSVDDDSRVGSRAGGSREPRTNSRRAKVTQQRASRSGPLRRKTMLASSRDAQRAADDASYAHVLHTHDTVALHADSALQTLPALALALRRGVRMPATVMVDSIDNAAMNDALFAVLDQSFASSVRDAAPLSLHCTLDLGPNVFPRLLTAVVGVLALTLYLGPARQVLDSDMRARIVRAVLGHQRLEYLSLFADTAEDIACVLQPCADNLAAHSLQQLHLVLEDDTADPVSWSKLSAAVSQLSDLRLLHISFADGSGGVPPSRALVSSLALIRRAVSTSLLALVLTSFPSTSDRDARRLLRDVLRLLPRLRHLALLQGRRVSVDALLVLANDLPAAAPLLRSVALTDVPVSREVAHALAHRLLPHLPLLERLDLGIISTPDAYADLADALVSVPGLTHLQLSGQADSVDASVYSALQRVLPMLTRLRYCCVRPLPILSTGTAAPVLQACLSAWPSLLRFRLSDWALRPADLPAILPLLSKAPALSDVSLRRRMSPHLQLLLCRDILPALTGLQVLDVCGAGLDDRACFALADAVAAEVPGLRLLNVSDNDFASRPLHALFAALAVLPRFLRLIATGAVYVWPPSLSAARFSVTYERVPDPASSPHVAQCPAGLLPGVPPTTLQPSGAGVAADLQPSVVPSLFDVAADMVLSHPPASGLWDAAQQAQVPQDLHASTLRQRLCRCRGCQRWRHTHGTWLAMLSPAPHLPALYVLAFHCDACQVRADPPLEPLDVVPFLQ